MRITSFAYAEGFSLNIYTRQTKCLLILLQSSLGFLLTSITEGRFGFSLSFILIIICYCRKAFLFFLVRSRIELFPSCVTRVDFPYIHIHLLFFNKKSKLNQHFVSISRARCESIFFSHVSLLLSHCRNMYCLPFVFLICFFR